MTTPRLLSERYELGPALGYGGMSEVHGGRDVRLGRDVAIKVLRADLARDPQFQVRFRREAQNAAALNHPAIVAVYDTGETPTDDVPLPYIVMEYVAGRTLRDIVKTEGPMEPFRVCEVLADVCAALDYSHRHGIIHRDVKPANIMITPAGAVKVMDFGIARALSDAQPAVTQTAAVIGTAQYLSPEQARGESVDARSDVYATGCVLFELLTGRPPFTGDSPVAIAYQHVREDPPAPSEINPHVPPALDAITLKSLAKNPSNRYQSADEMREDFYRVLSGEQPGAPMVMTEQERTEYMTGGHPVAGVTGPVDQVDDFAEWQAEQAEARRRRGRRRAIGFAAVLALLAALAGAYFLFSPSANAVAVPTVVGQPQAAALQTLSTAGLRPTVVPVASTPEQVGQVVTTNPTGGLEVAPGSVVELRVGRGPDRVQVPDLTGQTANEAQASVQRLGLSLAPVPQQREVDDASQIGRVLAQEPAAGQFLAPGTPVQLTIGRQRETLRMPDVTGQDRQTATTTLEGVGLRVDVTEVDGGGTAGTVVSTSPSAGAQVPRNSSVTLRVSRGNQGQVQVPSLVGQLPSDAVQTLVSAGFRGGNLQRTSQSVNDPSQDGKILSQNPTAGSSADPGSSVAVVVGRYQPGSDDGGGLFPGGN
ncbi:Stk1 family PASTA domain-containing Ser/Thr kinase [Actinomycetospora lutea]|uniref:Stk1 family PASTA domain-containing Ser/Thr kinase n=1 Tax=Actinomycetospora lutea TaxID=663604 RepID=UPI002366BF8B|nr:Stk1 family PASTA domain-containing Ser/Thr kinase [Actinomycetospora lutea]MDD7941297.1 Stk1 family PASTA domain-containing Ser/Thr kinase [Actinomycetospora lutea]